MAVSSTFASSDGNAYELQMGRWSRRLAPRFVRFAGVGHADRVLDVGCGTGSLSFYLAQTKLICAVQGVDLSSAYIDHARRQSHEPSVSFQVADACALPFPDASFDHTLSMLAIQFIPQVDVALDEMRRVTRPGGTIAAATWDTRGGFVPIRMIFDTAAIIDPNGNEARGRFYTRPMSRPGDLMGAFRDAGFAEIVEDMLTIRMEFSSFGDFWTPHESKEGPVAEYMSTLSPGIRHKLRRAVELAYLDGDPDGPRSYAATAWVVKGRVLSMS